MKQRPVQVIGVPLDHGAGRRGVGMGPAAMRVAGLDAALERLGAEVRDTGDLVIPAPETEASGRENARFLDVIARTCTQLAERVKDALDAGALPLVLGGDHSIAIGTISGIAAHLAPDPAGQRPPKLAVLWFDAHGDINTPETTHSGNIHGMPVSCLLGNGPAELTGIGFEGTKIDPARFAQIGLRDIDETEKRLLRESGIRTYTMADIDRLSMSRVMDEAIAMTEGAEMLHVSFDIDAVDPAVAPGTGTPRHGGLTYREAHLAMEMLADTGKVTSVEMVEVNPTLDERNRTAEVAVELISSLLGQRIL
jgi:arginase